jgi:DNA-binding ferritin-like protein (Dps family)
MADADNYLLGPTANPEDQAVGTAADFGKTFAAGTTAVGSNLAGALRYGWELGGSEGGAQIAKGLQDLFSAGTDSIEGTINPETRKLAASHLTSDEFWAHPVLATALKTTNMLPSVAAMAIPGGLMADAVEATMIAAGAGGVLQAGEGLDEFYRQLDAMPDKKLQEQSPKYKAMREIMDEADARKRFNREAQGWGPAINAVLGAVTGAVGPAGTAARGLAGGAENAVLGAGERGALKSGAIGAAEGVGANALQEGVADAVQQNAEIEAGMSKEFDRARTANAALEGGAMGGLFGGAVGVVAGGHGGERTAAARPPKVPDEVATTAVASPQVKEGSTGVPAKPAEIEANPQNAPTTTERDMGKADKKTAKPKNETPPPPIPVDPAIAAAVETSQPAAQASATEVAAMPAPMETRSPNETLDKLDQEGVTPPGNTPSAPPVSGKPEVVAPESTGTALDTGQNVPEAPQSIPEQIAQIGTGGRKAAMFPKGTVVPADALGGRKDLRKHRTARGTFIYDPKLTNPAEIQKLSKVGRENELLGLGPVSKPQAVADAAAGATPVAITERTPAGTEVKAAAGTTATLPEQRAALEAAKTPGNAVAVETPEQVVAARQNAAGGRVLPNLQQSEAERNAVAPKPPEAPTITEEKPAGPGKNYRGKAGQERDAALAHSKDVVAAYPADNAAEDGYHRLPARRDVVVARLRAMVADAEKRIGKPIQSQIKRSAKGDALSDDPNVLLLRLAKDVVKTADKHPQGKAVTDAVTTFKADEALIHAGAKDEVIARRLEEGDRASRKTGGEENDIEQHADTTQRPESIDENKHDEAPPEGVEEVVADTGAVKDKTDVELGAREHDEADLTDSDQIEQGPSVKHIEVKQEKAKSNLSPREARKAALAELAKAKIKNDNVDEVIAGAQKVLKRPALVSLRPRADALRVERNPTEGQIRAGNYKKGHRSVEGLDFTIENPKGAVRRGRGEDGTEWSVHMPADYGYLRRTTGADGDHVDAYDGRSGKRFFIVDQLDPRTGEFDEHKVMMRFDSEEAALEAYHRAFSDGSGADRAGNIHEVTVPELKQWLDEGDTARPATLHFFGEDPTMAQLAPDEPAAMDTLRSQDGSYTTKSQRSDYLVNELNRLNLEDRAGVGGTLAKFFLSRFKKLAEQSDHVVHYVTTEQMQKLFPGTPAAGMHVRDGNGISHILLDSSLRDNGLENGSLAHVLLHETAHAFTVREIENSPAAEATIRRLMHTAADWMEHPNNAPHVELLYGAQSKGGDVTRYAFTNTKEFVAEAFSNKGFQELLTQIPMNDPVMAEYLGMSKRSMSMWDVFRGFVKKAVEKVTGVLPKGDSVLDAIMKVGEGLELAHQDNYIAPRLRAENQGTHLAAGEAFNMSTRAAEGVRRLLESREANVSAPKALKLRTFDNIARIADHYFGESNPVRKIHSAIERMRVTGERMFQASEPIVRNLVSLRTKNRAAYEELSSLMHDATVANVHPGVPLTDVKNAHLGKNAMRGVWAKAQHPELAKRYNALPDEYKAAFHQTTKYFRDEQNKMSLGIIENQILKLMGHEDAALARRVHEGNLTDADKQLLGENVGILEDAGELSKIEGPYVPLMRRGDHVVKGDYKVTSPGNAKVISNQGGHVEFEFGTQKEAEDYVKASPLQPTLKKIWVNEKTGEKSGANELDSVARYRVTLQNRHVEFVQGKRAAIARAAELAKDGSLTVHEVVPRSLEINARQGAELSTALSRLVKKLEHSDAYRSASSTEKAALRRSIEEAALAAHGSTRVSSRALPRRGVQGYSEDLVQNTVDYAGSSSRYLAKLEHGPDLEAGLKAMAEQLDRDHSKVGQYARTSISNEVRDRVEGDNGFDQGGKFSPVVKRLLSASFTDKLASPAYSVINAMQPGMVTMPYLSGKYGVGRSFAALGRAYADINSGSVLKAGAKGTATAARGKEAKQDLMSMVMRKLSDDERAMIQHNLDEGVIDGDAGMEVQHLARSYEGVGGKADAALAYMEAVSREMPRAIETINRSVTALATYRLERSKGASHDAAVQASTDAVNSTQFNYSPTNSPAVFNHPLLKIALQFKKYGQGIYQLIGTQIGDAIRNAEPGDRARAIKTLIGIAATHTAMAGALGLPTEPFKYLVMAASPVTGVGWSDVENEIRRQAAALFGKTAGEVATRGLPRLLNLDLSRMGLDSVLSFGEPKSNKESDVKTWLFDSVSGPVVSLGVDYVKGLGNIASGNFEKAAEQLIPIKMASDTLRAYRQASEGKKTAGGKQSSAPYAPSEAALRVLGFGNAREAEEGAQRSAYYRESSKAKEERSALANAWVEADPSRKAKAWAAIQKFNMTAPAESKITAKELTDKARRDAKAAKSSTLGITPNKRDKRFLEEGVYNVR